MGGSLFGVTTGGGSYAGEGRSGPLVTRAVPLVVVKEQVWPWPGEQCAQYDSSSASGWGCSCRVHLHPQGCVAQGPGLAYLAGQKVGYPR